VGLSKKEKIRLKGMIADLDTQIERLEIRRENYKKQLIIPVVGWRSEQLRSSCEWCNGNNRPIDGGTSYDDLGK